MPRMPIAQVEEVLRQAVALCYGIDPSGDIANSTIRKSWPTTTEEGTLPDWARLSDTTFIRLVENTTDEYSLRKDITYRFNEAENVMYKVVGETVVWDAQIIFTGPGAPQNAPTVRSLIFSELVKRFLRQNNLYPVTAVPPALRNPEMYQNKWWERCDLVITLYECAITETAEPYFSSAPVSVQP